MELKKYVKYTRYAQLAVGVLNLLKKFLCFFFYRVFLKHQKKIESFYGDFSNGCS